MARTYSNFLLFEDVLDNLPNTSSRIILQAVDLLLNPIVKVVEEDCHTVLGEVSDLKFESEGLTYIQAKYPTSYLVSNHTHYITSTAVLDNATIMELLAQGIYKVGIRNLHSCNSHLNGGICRKCYSASLFGEEAPIVGYSVSIPTKLVYQTDTIIGNNLDQDFVLSETDDSWYSIKVIKDGLVLVEGIDYTLSVNSEGAIDTIHFPSAPGINSIYIVHMLKENLEPFLGVISKSYSGGLLGIKPLPTLKTMLRESLYQELFSDTFLELILEEVKGLTTIPVTYIDYLDKIHDKLEKVLYTLFVYAIFKNVKGQGE